MQPKENVSLKDYSTMRVGGNAKYFAEATSETELVELIEWANKNKQKTIAIGGGSNIIWSDQGYDGLVILNRIKGHEIVSVDNDKVIVSSFDHYVLQRLRQLDSDIQLALLADAILIDMPKYALDLGVNYLHLCLGSCRAEIVEEAHQAGLKVTGWTANGRRAWLDAIKMGVDGIVTDDPAELMVLLGRAMLLD